MGEGETIVFTDPPHLSTLSLPSSLHIPPKRRRLLRDRGFFSAHRNYLAIAVKSHSKEVWAGELGEETFLSFTSTFGAHSEWKVRTHACTHPQQNQDVWLGWVESKMRQLVLVSNITR